MIEIHPIRDKDELLYLYFSADLVMNDSSIAVVASDGDEIIGYCLFDLNKDNLVITSLQPIDDIMLADGILRAALHVGVENFVTTAFYCENLDGDIFAKLGFIKNADTRELNVSKLFSSCENCKK